MDIKSRLKERLLEIPPRNKAYREKFRLADDLDVDPKDLEPILNEFCDKGILTKKIEYICPTCRNTTILDKKLLEEAIDEDNCFECDNCMNLIDPEKNKTGYIYYDIKDKEALTI